MAVEELSETNRIVERERCWCALLGKLFSDRGERITRSHTKKKNGHRCSYYVSSASTRNLRKQASVGIPCFHLERLVANAVTAVISDPRKLIEWGEFVHLSSSDLARLANWTQRLSKPSLETFIFRLVERVEIGDKFANIVINPAILLLHVTERSYLKESEKLARVTIVANGTFLATR